MTFKIAINLYKPFVLKIKRSIVTWLFDKMNHRHLGKKWERESRRFLETKFNTTLIFKLINPEQIDWIVFLGNQKIALVESKSTKKDVYYPFENQKRRNQINKYLEVMRSLSLQGFSVSFYLLLKKRKEVIFQEINELGEIKRKY